MTDPARLTDEALDTALAALFDRHPHMQVAAVSPDGLFVPIPASVPFTTQTVLDRHTTALQFVLPDELVATIDAWEQAVQLGAAHIQVHLISDPEHTVVMHFVDARHRHGVLMCCVTGQRTTDDDATTADNGIRPRLAVMHKDERAVIRRVDDATTRILGWSAEEMVGRRSLEFVHPDDHQRAIANWMDMLSHPATVQRVRLRHRHRDGAWIWFEISNRNRLAEPEHLGVIAEMIDISDEMAAQEALRANEQLLRRLTEALPLGVLQIDIERTIVYSNDRLDDIVGVSDARTVDELFSKIAVTDRPALNKAVIAALAEGRDADLQFALTHRYLGSRRCAVSVRALTSDSDVVTGAILCIADVTDDARLREELERRATYDALTRCHNRAATIDALERMLIKRRHGDSGVGVLFFDLDGFKTVNDRLGHAAGDELLRKVAGRLLAVARDGDLVGRLGGDEFLVICPGVAGPEDAMQIGTRMARSLVGDIAIGDVLMAPRASVGVVWTAGDDDADTLVARADAAMYESKLAGEGRPVLAQSAVTRPAHHGPRRRGNLRSVSGD